MEERLMVFDNLIGGMLPGAIHEYIHEYTNIFGIGGIRLFVFLFVDGSTSPV